jgi:hypothetical protein
MNKRYLTATLLACVLANGIQAQSVLSGNYPFGLPLAPGSGMSMNMGGTGIGIRNDHNVLLSNPANLGSIRTTAFSSLIALNGLRLSDADAASNHLTFAPKQISFAFPLDIIGTMAVSLNRQTDATVKYRMQSALAGSDYIGRISLDRRGGLTTWQVGWGRAFGKYFSAGLAYQRLNLTIKSTKLIDLIGAEATTTRDSTCLTFSGNGLRLGFLGLYKKLTAGLSLDYNFNGDLHYSRGEYRGTQTTTFDSLQHDATSTAALKLPMTVGMGLSYQFSPEWLLGLDVKITNWDNFASGGLLPESSLRMASGFSAGVQFIPAPDLLSPRYWEVIRYRAGMRAAQLPAEGNNEFAFSLGTGLPLTGDGLLDIVVEAGNRWDSRFANYSEMFFSFAIGVNGGRTWNKSGAGTY